LARRRVAAPPKRISGHLPAGGAALTLVEEDPLPQAGTLMFPALLDRVNDVTEVEVTSGGKTYRLAREDSGWVAPDRDGYPLDGDKVHQLLVGTAGLERIEPKTGNPELYVKLGLEDPTGEDADSVRYVLKAGDGNAVADIIVGRLRRSLIQHFSDDHNYLIDQIPGLQDMVDKFK